MPTKPTFDSLPDSAFIRKDQLVAPPGSGALSILPFSGTTLWRRVRHGSFPKPVKVSSNVTAWRIGDIRGWLRASGESADGEHHDA